jgi:hypothetical protein
MTVQRVGENEATYTGTNDGNRHRH